LSRAPEQLASLRKPWRAGLASLEIAIQFELSFLPHNGSGSSTLVFQARCSEGPRISTDRSSDDTANIQIIAMSGEAHRNPRNCWKINPQLATHQQQKNSAFYVMHTLTLRWTA
jgi:hypothetical protein